MRKYRIVHTADLHLGSHFSSTPEVAARRKLEQLETLKNIINIAHENESAALLISGDLFDSLRVDMTLLSEVQSIFKDCGMRVFIAPGNHDPFTPDSSYMLPGWSDNVHIFRGDLECVELPEDGVCIWGLAFRHSMEVDCLLPEFTPKDNMINILMMHGEVVPNDDSESRYNPVTADKLIATGVDYCALGHTHKPTVDNYGDFVYCSPGCPSARGFDEQGDHGVYVGMVSNGFSRMEFVSTNTRRYIVERANVEGCGSVDDFCREIKASLEKSVGEDYAEHIYDITLIGALPKGILPNISAISRQLMDEMYFVRLTDMTTTELDMDMLMKDTSLRGAFVRTMYNRMEDDKKNRNLYMRALLYGLRAFDGEVRISEDY